jgi:hypothetical protein
MRKAGIDQAVRMKITGHKTDSMERRYDIMDATDISDAGKNAEALSKKERRKYAAAR